MGTLGLLGEQGRARVVDVAADKQKEENDETRKGGEGSDQSKWEKSSRPAATSWWMAKLKNKIQMIGVAGWSDSSGKLPLHFDPPLGRGAGLYHHNEAARYNHEYCD